MTESGSGNHDKAARYRLLTSRCGELLLGYCAPRLELLHEQAGTALLDFAERAESNSVQGRFFEAISHLNHHRDTLMRQFLALVSDDFERFGQGAGAVAPTDLGDYGELSLIAPEEMEESVACENIIIKANANCFPELYALSQRLAVLNHGKKVRDSEIVGGPHQLVHAWRHAMRPLEVDVKIKIVLYALFDKHVMRDLLPTYRDMNRLLKEEGVLPHIKPVSVKKAREREIRERAQRQEEQAKDAAGASNQDNSLGTELFESIVELMSKRRSGSHAGADRPLISRGKVLNAFDKLPRREKPQPAPDVVGSGSGGEMRVDQKYIGRVKETLSQEREQVLDALDRDQLAPVDADLIDLIGLLFEYMLNDPVLPNSAKALISHLHTPYLKLALIDRRLLVNSDHPARQLLDEMVEAGSLWLDENQPNRGIYPHIQRVVDRVLQEFSDDVSLFDELLTYFRNAVEEQRKRTDSMERRTTEAARGREKLQLARQRAAAVIQGLIQQHPLPKPLTLFLRQAWLDLLAFILLRNEAGEESEAWLDAMDIANQLVDLFDPGMDSAELTSRLPGLPGLRSRLQTAVRSLGGHHHSVMEQLNALLDDPAEWRNRLAQGVEPAADPAEDGGTPASYMRAIVDDSDETDMDDEERAMIERLRKTKFGTWFEFRTEDGSPPQRVKLSWMSLLTSTCMFVDRAGVQAEVKTLRELAREVLSGRARVIPKQQHPFIERALVSIRKALSQDEGANGQGHAAPGNAAPTPTEVPGSTVDTRATDPQPAQTPTD